MDSERSKGSLRFPAILLMVLGLHVLVLLTMVVYMETKETREDTTLFKIVDVTEPAPPPKPAPPPLPAKPKEVVEIPPQAATAEIIVETEKKVVETAEPPSPRQVPDEPDYLPQHKISAAPKIPADELRRNIVYPPLANRQRIEGVVYLELFIDKEGRIRKIDVLKDPGFGLAEAAVAAFQGIRCLPAESNGQPVAVRYRYPIRFQLR